MNLVAITFFSSPFLFDLAIFMAEEQGEERGSWFLHHLRASGHHPWAAVEAQGGRREKSRSVQNSDKSLVSLFSALRGKTKIRNWNCKKHWHAPGAKTRWDKQPVRPTKQTVPNCKPDTCLLFVSSSWQHQYWFSGIFLLSNRWDSTCRRAGPTFALLCRPLHRHHSHSSLKESR